MGNSASNANNPNRGPALPPSSSVSNRTTSASPGPGNPHRSMRTKKKSLELPDLANLSITHQHAAARGRPAVPAKTASIPIPTQPQGPFNHYREAQAEPSPDPRTSRNLDSASDVYLAGQVIEPSTHQPFPPVSRAVHYHNASAGGAPRGRQQPMSNARHQAQVTRLQELYDRSHTPAAPPSSPATSADSSVRPGGSQRPGFVAETVRSSIPIALGKAAKLAEEAAASTAGPMKEDLLADPVPVKIVWKGGGRDVVLARAGDNEWKGRQPMERESPQSNTWSTTVSLRPGTHHIRFLIDGTWRVADDLPTAVDDQGSLANYVAVPLNYGFPPTVPTAAPTPTLPQQAQQAKKLIPGQSFWSADSSADGEGDVESTTDSSSTARKASSSDPKHAHTPQSAAQAAVVAYTQARWTNVLPLELIEAAREEEAYLAASAGQYEAAGSGAGTNVQRVMGFVPAPNIPPAPGLPRHLDKLILNSKVGERVVALAGGSRDGRDGPRERERERERDRDGHGRDKDLGGVGSGQGGSGRRERDRRERERGERERGDRDRERGTRRRPTVPPPPPPSEDGSGDQEAEIPMNPNVNNTPVLGAPQDPPPPSTTTTALPTSTSLPEQSALAAMAASSQPLLPSAAIVPSTSTSTPASTNTTPPATKESTPTPSASTSAGALTDSTGGTGSSATSTATSGTTTAATSPQGSAPTTPTAPLSPGATHAALKTLPPGTPLPTGLPAPAQTQTHTPPLQQGQSQPTTPGTQPHAPPLERAGISGSRIITIDTANMPTLTDDGSVLPVPSHVVLHHLSTSAIRNGVLAVANTTRYRKKYLTTIYYKPT